LRHTQEINSIYFNVIL